MKPRRKNRCLSLSPSPHPAYHRKQCELKRDHDGVCKVKVGVHHHYWQQEFYNRRGLALWKDDDA